MRDAVSTLSVKLFDTEPFNETTHARHRVGGGDAGCRHRMVGDHGDLVGIEHRSRRLVPAGNAEYDIQVDHEVEIRHDDVTRLYGLPCRMG